MNNCHMMYSEPIEYDHNYIYYHCFYENGIFKYMEIKNILNVMASKKSKVNYTRDTHILRVHKCYPKISHHFILYVKCQK